MYTELISYAYTVVIVVGYVIIAHCMRMHVFTILSTLSDSSLNPLQIDVRSGIRMAQMDLSLPEITKEDFLRAWTRFELVAAAKDWNTAKRATMLPTLLRGKLVDIYIKLSEEIRGDLVEVKKAVMSKAGLTKDSLVAGKEFITRIQQDGQPVNTFTSN